MKVLWLLLVLSLPALAEGLPLTRPGPPPPVATLARVEGAIPALEELVEKTMAATGVPGMSIAIVFQQQVVYLKGFGLRQAGQPQPVDADTVFQLASLSKPLASTVVAMLVKEGVVSWDDPVVKHDPDFALSDSWVSAHVTLADLFSHRSGLPDHAGDWLEDLGFTRAEILRRLRLHQLAPFRISYAYTNFGLTEAALAAARAAGQPWEELCARKLYEPLGMKSTSSRFADFVKAPNWAAGHVRLKGRWEARCVREPDAQSPAGGVSSSARDMAGWLKFQLANADLLAQTRLPHILTSPPLGFYGLGWGVGVDAEGRLRLSHSGAFSMGAATCVAMVPGDQLGIVVLTNGEPHGIPEAMADAFLEQVLTGRVQRDWVRLRDLQFTAALYPEPRYRFPPAHPAPPRGGYAGTYASEYYGPGQILEKAGGLVLVLGPRHREFPLRHWDGEVFLYDPVGEQATGPSAVTFTAQGMVVEDLNVNQLGVFTRK